MICVLVVDDAVDVRLAFGYMLEALGCQIAEASDGEAALEYLKTHRVDVVLTDIYMPRLDGVSLIDAIRAKLPKPPKIIAISGDGNIGYKAALQAALVVGADAVLTKPVSKETLLDTIRRITTDGGDQRGKR